ncbi:MAG: hypothetical protein MUE72_10045 [Chitinophagaceae bacterium]|jgi:hypothetical protein|nr:hypothetical protein [Chitinophagaceae bacterium]
MQTRKFLTLLSVAIFTTVVTSCNNGTESKTEKLEDAKEEVIEARKDLNEARLDSANEYAKYRADVQQRLQANEDLIAATKVQMKANKAAFDANAEKTLFELEQQNANLRATINDYKEGSYSTWENFKSSFNKQVDDLGKSISALSKK